jgi:hypothetical protein
MMNFLKRFWPVLVAFVCAISLYLLVNHYRKTIERLENIVAVRDKTIEISKGVYERLSVQSADLAAVVSSKDSEVKALLAALKKGKRDVLSLTQLSVTWKKAYESAAMAHQVDITEGGEIRHRVDFEKDFGYIGVKGYTLTSPPFAWVHAQQNRPLRLALAISRGPDGAWRSTVASSEEDVSVDVSLASVDPGILRAKWYEKISISLAVGVSSAGGVAAAGVGYDIGHLTISPTVFTTYQNTYYGGSLAWRPFSR